MKNNNIGSIKKARRNQKVRRNLVKSMILGGIALTILLTSTFAASVIADHKMAQINTDITVVENTDKKEIKEVKEESKKADKKEVKKAAKKESKKEVKEEKSNEVCLSYDEAYNVTKDKLNRVDGVKYYDGHKETYYSVYEPGQTVTAKKIPGKHVADDGTYRDKDGYICLAIPMDGSSVYDYGDVIMTSLGPGKVYDCGDMVGDWIDIYTNWEV